MDDATLQVYKDGDYGAYLDLESSLAEQSEELEGLHSKYVFQILIEQISTKKQHLTRSQWHSIDAGMETIGIMVVVIVSDNLSQVLSRSLLLLMNSVLCNLW